jgi:hypothetical protein
VEEDVDADVLCWQQGNEMDMTAGNGAELIGWKYRSKW